MLVNHCTSFGFGVDGVWVGGIVTGELDGIGIVVLVGGGVGVWVGVPPFPDGVAVGDSGPSGASGFSFGSPLGVGVGVAPCPGQYAVGPFPALKYSVIVVQFVVASLPVTEQTFASSIVEGISKSFAGKFLLIASITFFHTGIHG